MTPINKSEAHEQLSSAEVTQFVEYLTEILANARPKFNPELQQLIDSSKDLKLMGKFHHGADPFTFGRMSGILYRDTNPTMGELSKILSHPLSTMTRIADAGEDFGIVQRLARPRRWEGSSGLALRPHAEAYQYR